MGARGATQISVNCANQGLWGCLGVGDMFTFPGAEDMGKGGGWCQIIGVFSTV